MMEQELTMVFDYQSVETAKAWELIALHLEDRGLSEELYEIGDSVVSFDQIRSILQKRGKTYFGIKGEKFEFDLTIVGTYEHDAIRIAGTSGVEWDEWVNHLHGAGRFVQAFLVDSEYDFWQNAEDPLQYKSRNRSCEGLPMKSNGLLFPLEQKIVDISKNPGRRALHVGFIEAIGSPMWFAERFWELTGGSKDFKQHDRVIIEDRNGISRISLGETITNLTDGAIQIVLRQKLFPHV